MLVALIFFIIIIFIVGLIFSKLIIDVKEINIHTDINTQKIYLDKFQINLELYLYRFFRIINIKIYKNYFKVFGIKFSLEKKIQEMSKIRKNVNAKKIFRILKRKKMRQKLNLKLEKIKLIINVGTENACFTAFCTTIISTILSIIYAKNIKNYNKENYTFKVTPNYFNINNLDIDLEGRLSFKARNILKMK